MRLSSDVRIALIVTLQMQVENAPHSFPSNLPANPRLLPRRILFKLDEKLKESSIKSFPRRTTLNGRVCLSPLSSRILLEVVCFFCRKKDNLHWSDQCQHLSLKYQQTHSVDDRLSCWQRGKDLTTDWRLFDDRRAQNLNWNRFSGWCVLSRI